MILCCQSGRQRCGDEVAHVDVVSIGVWPLYISKVDSRFDPTAEQGSVGDLLSDMKIPTWITVRKLVDEFRGVAKEIATRLGDILGKDVKNDESHDPRFSIAHPSRGGWEPHVFVDNTITKCESKILVNYNFLPIRCRFCLDTSHCVRACPQQPDPRTGVT